MGKVIGKYFVCQTKNPCTLQGIIFKVTSYHSHYGYCGQSHKDGVCIYFNIKDMKFVPKIKAELLYEQ